MEYWSVGYNKQNFPLLQYSGQSVLGVCFRRARRGASGALYPQSAIAGFNSRSEVQETGHFKATAGVDDFTSYAILDYLEPRQARKGAAVRYFLYVP